MKDFSTGLSDAERERLALLAEECGEVIQVIGKILRHGFESRHPDGGPTNRELLEIELGHVGFAGFLCETFKDVSAQGIYVSRYEKSLRIAKYLHFQE